MTIRRPPGREAAGPGVLGIAELTSWYGRAPEDLREKLGETAQAATAGDDDDEDERLYPPSGMPAEQRRLFAVSA